MGHPVRLFPRQAPENPGTAGDPPATPTGGRAPQPRRSAPLRPAGALEPDDPSQDPLVLDATDARATPAVPRTSPLGALKSFCYTAALTLGAIALPRDGKRSGPPLPHPVDWNPR